MSMQQQIESKLQQAFSPAHLQVINESHMHRVAPGAESHFKVVVVSEQFVGQRPLVRHRSVNSLLAAELSAGVHALALHTYTPEEWSQLGEAPRTAPCIGKP